MAPKKTGKTTTIVGRQEIIRHVAAASGLTQKKSAEVLEAMLDSIQESLKQGHEVRLVRFGSFKVRKSAPREGVNPRDQQRITVPAKNRVRFSPGKLLSEAVVEKK